MVTLATALKPLGLVEEELSLEEAIGKTYLLHGDMIPAGEHFERPWP
jgi:hypothetical protein